MDLSTLLLGAMIGWAVSYPLTKIFNWLLPKIFISIGGAGGLNWMASHKRDFAGLAVIIPCFLYGLFISVQIVANPENWLNYAPTLGLCILGTEFGTEIINPPGTYL